MRRNLDGSLEATGHSVIHNVHGIGTYMVQKVKEFAPCMCGVFYFHKFRTCPSTRHNRNWNVCGRIMIRKLPVWMKSCHLT